jgi:hypothetical protein
MLVRVGLPFTGRDTRLDLIRGYQILNAQQYFQSARIVVGMSIGIVSLMLDRLISASLLGGR